MCGVYVLLSLRRFLFFAFCSSSHMYWGLLMTCLVVECRFNVFYAVVMDGFRSSLILSLVVLENWRTHFVLMVTSGSCWHSYTDQTIVV